MILKTSFKRVLSKKDSLARKDGRIQGKKERREKKEEQKEQAG